MPNYEEMYKTLFRAVTKAIDLLQKAQQMTEELYIADEAPDTQGTHNASAQDV